MLYSVAMGLLLGGIMYLIMLMFEQWLCKRLAYEREEEVRMSSHLLIAVVVGVGVAIYLERLSSPEEIENNMVAVVSILCTYVFILFAHGMFRLKRKRRQGRRRART